MRESARLSADRSSANAPWLAKVCNNRLSREEKAGAFRHIRICPTTPLTASTGIVISGGRDGTLVLLAIGSQLKSSCPADRPA